MKTRTELIKSLLDNGYRLFDSKEFAEVASGLGYFERSIKQLVFELKKEGIIESVKPGLHSLHSSFLPTPLSEYEIALHAIKNGFLSHLTAIRIHDLTDQLPLIVYVSVNLNDTHYTGKNAEYSFEARGIKYKVVKVKPDRIFGIEEKWIGGSIVRVTNLERTLVDAITRPAYCGGFHEAISYIDQAKDEINVDKIIEYATIYGTFCLQRVGWIYDHIGYKKAADKIEANTGFKTFAPLDSSGARRGQYNKKWKVIENI